MGEPLRGGELGIPFVGREPSLWNLQKGKELRVFSRESVRKKNLWTMNISNHTEGSMLHIMLHPWSEISSNSPLTTFCPGGNPSLCPWYFADIPARTIKTFRTQALGYFSHWLLKSSLSSSTCAVWKAAAQLLWFAWSLQANHLTTSSIWHQPDTFLECWNLLWRKMFT